MLSNNDSAQVFGFVGRGHAFAAPIDALRAAVAREPAFAPFRQLAGGDCDVHADLKAERGAAGHWALQSAYWCLQHRTPAGRQVSHMVLWKPGQGTRLFAFPQDPSLPTLAAALAAAPGRVDVLRYVPLRRVTFRESGPHGECIAKLKRRTQIRASYERLASVHAAVRAQGAGVRVAAPLGLDEQACVFRQEALAGRSLVGGIGAASARERLALVGRVHRSLHGLEVAGVPGWSLEKYLATIRADVDWVALFDAGAGWRLLPVWQRLAATMPAPSRPVFCHGDFIASQLLLHGGQVAVTDFDAARTGERSQEQAKLLASLKYDLPYLRAALHAGAAPDASPMQEAEQAYLEAYARGGEGDLPRLRWFRTCAEIHYLAMTLKKDAFKPEAFARTLEFIVRTAP